MPYSSVKDIPDYVPSGKRKQWMDVWNSAYERAIKDGKSAKDAEARAFQLANGVAGPNAKSTEGDKTMQIAKFDKFIPFAKVDDMRREVWGIVTAEVPDKDKEVCDYAGSKPFYQAVIDEMGKATDGANFFPLRYMHQLEAIGKCVAFDFRDADKEIFMGFKVVNDEMWKLVVEKVLTGFSHGGKVVDIKPDPKFEGCKRYIADPSEVSLVDNPCLANAHFTHVKADGTVELCKFAKTLPAEAVTEDHARITALERQIELLKVAGVGVPVEIRKDGTLAKAKTKRVAGEDLPASAFLIVGDADKTETWKLPVKFASETKTKSHIRNAIARFDQMKDVPQATKDAAWKKLTALAGKYDIEVSAEKAKLAAIQAYLRKAMRTTVNKLARTVRGGNVGESLAMVDSDLGRLQKGMYDVGRLAEIVQGLAFVLYSVTNEIQFGAGDKDSEIPETLADNIDSLLDTLARLVEEESANLRADTRARTAVSA